jgi:hypothetical protein
MNHTKITLIAAAVLGAGGLGYWLLGSEPAHEGATLSAQASAQPSGPGPLGAASSARPQLLASAPDAERLDIDPASLFDIGYSGGLVVDKHLLTKLDGVVATLPDNPSAEDLAKLEHKLRQGLPREDADKAIKLVHSYRGYSHDMRSEIMRLGVPQTQEAAAELMRRMQAVQSRHFDPATAQAMFGQSNVASNLTMQAAIVSQDNQLSAAEKKQRLDALRAQLPPEQRELIPEPAAEPTASPGQAPKAP